jgi:GntR family transcriptional regulator/MocR family aminotransferase
MLVYENLAADGYLVSRERSGYFVSQETGPTRIAAERPTPVARFAPNWERRLHLRPTNQSNIEKPNNWRSYPYPFIYGQADPDLFPIGAWRECSRQALGKKEMVDWTSDSFAEDDPMLVEKVRQTLLPRRGIYVSSDQILITLGAQNALYLIATLLIGERDKVALEDPGYPDVRNIFGLRTNNISPIPVDEAGLPVDERLHDFDYVYVTPSHQFPTTVTMPMERRTRLLEKASQHRFLIIEDDYESEANYVTPTPVPALMSMDTENRVLYVGSLSKSLFPGLRLGYLVGPADFIAEARALRRLMLRHPPTNNQRTTALFLSLGHHDSLLRRLNKTYRARWQAMADALNKHFPHAAQPPTFGGTSFWVRGPEDLDAEKLARDVLKAGVIIEPGSICFFDPGGPRNYFRLGFSSIDVSRIEPGIKVLAEHVKTLLDA